MRVAFLVLTLVLVSQPLAGCGASYYLQAAAGQFEVLRARRPMERVLQDPATTPEVREQLLAADSALVFGRVALGLPRADGYRRYADLGRSYVLWNVFAAGEFSLEPDTWCFPVAGCVAYRGWFSERRARDDARRLAGRGKEVYVGGVPAYSTLGWLPDPLLNTMFGAGPADIGSLIFHELAHRRLYLPGDTAFSEGFASFVEREGTRRWLQQRGDAGELCRYLNGIERRARVETVLDGLRAELRTVYTSGMAADDMRRARDASMAEARRRHQALRAGWSGPPFFDGWFGENLNNALLAALGSYAELVPAFEALLAEAGGDLDAFYDRAQELAALPAGERSRRMEGLLQAGRTTAAPLSTCTDRSA